MKISRGSTGESSAKPNRHRFAKRVYVLGIIGPITVKAVLSGGATFKLISVVAAGCAGFEASRLLKLSGVPVSAAAATGASLAVSYVGSAGYASTIPLVLANRDNRSGKWPQLCSALAVGSYIGLPIHAGLTLSRSKNGTTWLMYGLVSTWANDAANYLIGPYLGGPLLPPSLSDKKTWAGFLPGIVVSAVIGGLSARRLTISRQEGFRLGMFLGIAAAAGDMVESGLKRQARQADSGVILPGYGGVLDRLDSLLASTAVLYWAYQRSSRQGADPPPSDLLSDLLYCPYR